MKFGINVPNFGYFGDIALLTEIAGEVEDAGWGGFFIWDHMLVFDNEGMTDFVDPWIALAAIALSTRKIRLGPLITPIPRRRPWKLARETVSLDHLSKGRLIVGFGIGAPPQREYEAFGEESDARIRAEKLDEGLKILTGLWSGEEFSHDGVHYQLDEMIFLPRPMQRPRIPIWIGGGWPHQTPFKRAALYDGVAPVNSRWPEKFLPHHLKDILKIIEDERGSLNDYDIVVCGETSGEGTGQDAEIISSWQESGVTWFLEDIHGLRAEWNVLRERIKKGPPQV
ncbi:LLM class flavin-dependent oxidoreductase [Candidatus Thorarchaeota archaeon]|nr:MAG: LLM class flavin-dependent oxidoreductase [Candidatus Thorarchaeota archaeon]